MLCGAVLCCGAADGLSLLRMLAPATRLPSREALAWIHLTCPLSVPLLLLLLLFSPLPFSYRRQDDPTNEFNFALAASLSAARWNALTPPSFTVKICPSLDAVAEDPNRLPFLSAASAARLVNHFQNASQTRHVSTVQSASSSRRTRKRPGNRSSAYSVLFFGDPFFSRHTFFPVQHALGADQVCARA